MTQTDIQKLPEPAADETIVKASPPPIHWREKVVLTLVAAHLIFLPWALGTMHLREQWVSLGLSAGTFLLAFILNPPSTRIIPKPAAWKKVVRSGSVWLGLAILGYIYAQALNPAYRSLLLGKEYWMLPIDHIEWLPSSMDTPFEKAGPYRRMMVFASVFLTIWTIKLFIERSKSLRVLFVLLAINAFVLASVAFAQFFTGAEKIFWTIPSASEEFYASFIYRNHAAAYLNLVLALTIGFYFYARERAWKTNKRGGDKSPVFFFLATVIFTAVLFSGSRGGMIGAIVLLLLSIGYTLIQAWRWNRLRESSMVSSVFLGLLVLFASVFIAVAGPERVFDRLQNLVEDKGGTSVDHRILASRATAEMFKDEWLFGWGAGSFEFAFPKYQQEYPEIHYIEVGRKRRRIYMIWEYAHNDWIQYPAEYGVAGVSLFLAGFLGWLVALWRKSGLRQPIAFWTVAGILLIIGHSLGDFILQNPAILVTAGAALAVSLRYVELRRHREAA